MKHMSRWAGILAIVVNCLVSGLVPGTANAGDELRLRVNDIQAVPGGIAVLVVRTYESLPLGQGQMCLQFNSLFADDAFGDHTGAGGRESWGPFEEFLGSVVFSSAGDARHRVTPEPGGNLEFLLEFFSPTATINDSDGPLVAHFMRLRSDLSPGTRFRLSLDPTDTWLINEFSNLVPIEVRQGVMTVRAPGAPIEIDADGGEARPGGIAAVALETIESIPLSRGRVILAYDPEIATGLPSVRIDNRIGEADFTVNHPAPGRTVVRFESESRNLNRLPGSIIEFAIPTRADVPLGTKSLVRFLPSSELYDREGNLLNVRFEAGHIEFEQDDD